MNSFSNNSPTPTKLRVICLNVGFNVMKNQIAGSEGAFVKLCQSKGESCITNSARLISTYDLVMLQEVSAQEWPVFLDYVRQLGRDRGANYQAFVSYYFGNWITAIVYDENVLGRGIQVTPIDFELYETISVKKTGSRGVIVVWFEKYNLMAVNLHAPHNVKLQEMIESRLDQTKQYLHQLKIGAGRIQRVLMGGDFNDDNSIALIPGFKMRAFGHELKLPVDPSLIPKTCCYDSNYKFTGDYILDSREQSADLQQGEYFGFPPGYRRGIDLYSDHDPVILITHLDGIAQPVAEKTKASPLKLEGMVVKGRIQTSGDYVEIQFPQLDQDQLLALAQNYVKEKGLNWQIRKPHAWTDYNSMPHITLHPSMKKFKGQEATAKLGKLYHFAAGKSRWVVVGAELPSGYRCEYECHLSIGQQRIK